jgi:hypothetical protein
MVKDSYSGLLYEEITKTKYDFVYVVNLRNNGKFGNGNLYKISSLANTPAVLIQVLFKTYDPIQVETSTGTPLSKEEEFYLKDVVKQAGSHYALNTDKLKELGWIFGQATMGHVLNVIDATKPPLKDDGYYIFDVDSFNPPEDYIFKNKIWEWAKERFSRDIMWEAAKYQYLKNVSSLGYFHKRFDLSKPSEDMFGGMLNAI